MKDLGHKYDTWMHRCIVTAFGLLLLLALVGVVLLLIAGIHDLLVQMG